MRPALFVLLLAALSPAAASAQSTTDVASAIAWSSSTIATSASPITAPSAAPVPAAPTPRSPPRTAGRAIWREFRCWSGRCRERLQPAVARLSRAPRSPGPSIVVAPCVPLSWCYSRPGSGRRLRPARTGGCCLLQAAGRRLRALYRPQRVLDQPEFGRSSLEGDAASNQCSQGIRRASGARARPAEQLLLAAAARLKLC